MQVKRTPITGETMRKKCKGCRMLVACALGVRLISCCKIWRWEMCNAHANI